MGIKTEDMVKNLPPKEMTVGVDWLGVADSFDSTKLDQRYLNECARRNSYDTCYRWEPPLRPMEDAQPDVILKWIKEGKPRETRWEEGRRE